MCIGVCVGLFDRKKTNCSTPLLTYVNTYRIYIVHSVFIAINDNAISL
uniref:Uncharacterized protein n=1 Tax=Anguilla anguilla TaxID=7936 RepID=A0A0E9U8J8_ANGAN